MVRARVRGVDEAASQSVHLGWWLLAGLAGLAGRVWLADIRWAVNGEVEADWQTGTGPGPGLSWLECIAARSVY